MVRRAEQKTVMACLKAVPKICLEEMRKIVKKQ
jgi:hypothetical protein